LSDQPQPPPSPRGLIAHGLPLTSLELGLTVNDAMPESRGPTANFHGLSERQRVLHHHRMTITFRAAIVCTAVITAALATACSNPTGAARLAGDWDVYVARGSTTLPGFEGWRRMGFAHFARSGSSLTGSIRRRTGEPILDIARIVSHGDSVRLTGNDNQSIEGTWRADTLSGTMLANGKPAGQRLRLIRRSTPFVVEQPYALWPGPVSD